MDDKQRIIALERELAETRRAAVMMMVGVLEVITESPEGRERLARGFEDAAEVSDPVAARLARLIALALRK